MTWEKVYKLPLRYGKYCPSIVRDSDYNHALDIFVEGSDEEFIKEIIAVLNGDSDKRFSVRTTKSANTLWVHDGKTDAVIIIRGWGRLIGAGGLHLPEDEATQIQDSFKEWIMNKLKK